MELENLRNYQIYPGRIGFHAEFLIGATHGANRKVFTTVILF